MQDDELVHETALSCVSVTDAAVTWVHWPPFHSSIKAWVAAGGPVSPTAMQNELPVQLTP
jgi:hypothetical protein